eukprot:TRINITY_DN1974_c0_g1_i1.p1 TRINITY_DN1974_c0_g1~~TRINITY_DN1974_c0_g1_i1.p1  ORF type:complete len:636 (-),score=163.08 TRINITY_DN1974_c0_g1_i1:301-2208(-)
MEEAFWTSLAPSPPAANPFITSTQWMNDSRLSFECPQEEVWIPSDQTIHWGKRPNYTYPNVKVLKKEELPAIPRGSKLVAKLWYSEWNWDEERTMKEETGIANPRPDPNSTSCFEEDKTIVPFEKNCATFRHLRTSKIIKLQKTETFIITGLGFEIGFHDPFAKIPFTSLEIFLSKPTKIHIVAHKGSVKLMQKHGLLPQSIQNGTIGNGVVESIPRSLQPSLISPLTTESPSAMLLSTLLNQMQEAAPSADPLMDIAPLTTPPSPLMQIQLSNDFQLAPIFDSLRAQVDPSSNNKRSISSVSTELEQQKKVKMSQMYEIMEELTQIQTRMDLLKRRINEFVTCPIPFPVASRAIRLTCNPEQFNPTMFIFYAFRIRNLDLAVSLMKSFQFDINETKDTVGLTILHISARYAFMEGLQWCIENGAQVNAVCNQQFTPLHMAYLRNDKNIRKTLKLVKADKDAINCFGQKPKDYYNQRQPLQQRARNPNNAGSVEVVIPGFDQPFVLSIWFASRIGWVDIVSMYINNLGVDVDIKSTNGQTPLMCACEYQHLDVVKYLLQMGAHPNARDIHDRTPLHYAYMNYRPDIVELLEKHGADPALTNVWNLPPQWYFKNNQRRTISITSLASQTRLHRSLA